MIALPYGEKTMTIC